MSTSIPSHVQNGATDFAGVSARGGRTNAPGAVQRGTTWFIGAIVLAGLLFLAGLWTEVSILTGTEQRMAIDHGRIDTSNLSAAFQEEISRELDRVAGAMNLVAAHVRADPAATDFHDWASQVPILSGATVRAAILGPDGRLLASTLEPNAKPIDNSDREQFTIQRDGTYHGLFIGKPIVGRLSGQPSIPISLRIEAADGRFLGVIVFSLAPNQLTTLHRSFDLGSRGMMALFGTDGIVRARFASDSPDGTTGAGQSVRALPERATADGSRDFIHISESLFDHDVRIYSDRRIEGYPLFCAVGLDLNEVLAPAHAHARQIEATAAAVTLLLCAHAGRPHRRNTAARPARGATHARAIRAGRAI